MVRPAVALAAFLRRDWAIVTSYRLPFAFELLDSFLGLVLFFFLSDFIDVRKLGPAVAQHGYFAYVVVGLAMLGVIHTALTAFAESVRADQTTGTLEALLATPASPALVIIGSACFELIRALLRALGTVLFALIFFDFRPVLDIGLVVALVVGVPAAMVLSAALGVAIAAFTVVFKQSAALLGFAGVAVGLLSGVYYPLSALPDVLHRLGDVLPFTWALDLMRAGVLGTALPEGKAILLVLSAAVSLPLSLRLFQMSIDHGRRTGTLTLY